MSRLRACLHGCDGPREVTRLGGVKKITQNNPPLHAILQPSHPGMHFLKTGAGKHVNNKELANHVFWRFMLFYTYLLLLLQASVLWLSIITFNNDAKQPPK